ncbi:MAG: methyltransferase domain-containing protein [Chitinophagaceae bacterium]|nr:methyltransferase domain-containing protein [Chitinophagaceae bacterium]
MIGEKLRLIKGNSECLPSPDNTFDLVFCINVIYFWQNPSKHLQEIKRVLKPGGAFYAIFRTKESMQFMPFTQFGFTAYDEVEWIQQLTENNFSEINHILLQEPEVVFKESKISIQSHFITGKKESLL